MAIALCVNVILDRRYPFPTSACVVKCSWAPVVRALGGVAQTFGRFSPLNF